MTTGKVKKLKRIRTLTKLLDSAVSIPGTKFKVGLDPIIGLVPAVGDYLSVALSGYVIFEAAKLGAKQETLIKMAINLLLDSFVGTVPVAGDLFDAAWRANEANLKLLEADLPQESQDGTDDEAPEAINWLPIIAIFTAIALVITLAAGFSLWFLHFVFQVLFT